MTTPDQQLFAERVRSVVASHQTLLDRPNTVDPSWNNGWYSRYLHPVITSEHVPLTWRYDFRRERNPRFLERLRVNATLNAGAIEQDGKICLVVRIEGADRKSFFGLAESGTGVDGFQFRGGPIEFAETGDPGTNYYDMRLTRHEDGWIYGIFCVERKDPSAPPGDLSSAVAQCGIVRTKDLENWERLPDIRTRSPQQRNIVLHPEFVDGQYAFYTRPQDSFIHAGTQGGLGFGLAADIAAAEIGDERIVDERVYHTIKEAKNGAGAPPLKTPAGWLHIAHGVRSTAAGLRYVLYAFLCDLHQPWKRLASPGGYFLAPHGSDEFHGDVPNVAFCNGVVQTKDGRVFIYYATADTRLNVATTDIDTLVDYCLNTPEDPLLSGPCARQRSELHRQNEKAIATLN